MTEITTTPPWASALAAIAKLYPCMSKAKREAILHAVYPCLAGIALEEAAKAIDVGHQASCSSYLNARKRGDTKSAEHNFIEGHIFMVCAKMVRALIPIETQP